MIIILKISQRMVRATPATACPTPSKGLRRLTGIPQFIKRSYLPR